MESPVCLHSFIASLNISLKTFPFLNLEIIFMAGIFLCVIITFIQTLYVHHNKSKPNKHIMNAGLPHQIIL